MAEERSVCTDETAEHHGAWAAGGGDAVQMSVPKLRDCETSERGRVLPKGQTVP